MKVCAFFALHCTALHFHLFFFCTCVFWQVWFSPFLFPVLFKTLLLAQSCDHVFVCSSTYCVSLPYFILVEHVFVVSVYSCSLIAFGPIYQFMCSCIFVCGILSAHSQSVVLSSCSASFQPTAFACKFQTICKSLGQTLADTCHA